MASSVRVSEPAIELIIILSVRNQAGRGFQVLQAKRLTLGSGSFISHSLGPLTQKRFSLFSVVGCLPCGLLKDWAANCEDK